MESSVDRLCQSASDATGLSDFGDDCFREPLEIFLCSGAEEGQLTDIGAAAMEGMALGNLVHRLKVVDWHTQHPEINQPIEKPIFLIGLPRTGTTALSHLLSVDPANRSLLSWEATDAVPPSTADWRNDPRFIAAEQAPNMLDLINPKFKTIHFDPVDMPVECATLLGQTFMSLHLATTFHVPSYMDALWDFENTKAYEFHKQILQVLQSGYGGQWQLKSPVHLIDPWALNEVYPDARFVLTHRDPVKVVASVCSLVETLAGTWTDADWRTYIQTTWPEVIARLLDNQLAFRDELEKSGRGDAFIDISYSEFVANPLPQVEQMYDALDMEFSTAARAAMVQHTEVHKKDRFGSHSYGLEEWGLSDGELRERFAPYLNRYDDFLQSGK